MGHEDARMVYEVYSKWIGDMNHDPGQHAEQSDANSTAPGRPTGGEHEKSYLIS